MTQIKNSWMGPIFLPPGDSHTKGLLALLHLGLKGITEGDTDPKGRFVTFFSNCRVAYVNVTSGQLQGSFG